jgi:hypothetical protein
MARTAPRAQADQLQVQRLVRAPWKIRLPGLSRNIRAAALFSASAESRCTGRVKANRRVPAGPRGLKRASLKAQRKSTRNRASRRERTRPARFFANRRLRRDDAKCRIGRLGVLHYHGRTMSTARPIGDLLREWRQRRRLSQLNLACEAENFHAAFESSRAVRVPLWRQRLSRPF